jgi:hypothetical protein
VLDFIREADRRIEADAELWRTPGFVPSDYGQTFAALRAIAVARLAPGNHFCEWGSGFGVVTCLAFFSGFVAWGIEIEPSLIQRSRQLAADFHIPVEFIQDSFFPRSSYALAEAYESSTWMVAQTGDGGDREGLETDDFDLIFAFPGPDDDEIMSRVFERYAGVGAMLLTFHGREGLRLRRKVRRRSKHLRHFAR